jgi:dCTP deaminase
VNEPWSDWIPGVLGKEQMRKLAEDGFLDSTIISDDTSDESSFDLHLTEEAYIFKHGAVKPSKARYSRFIKQLGEPLSKDDNNTFVLKPKTTYLFKLKEKLVALSQSGIYGQATAKSSVGRMDVLARLIVDGMSGYEGFEPEKLTGGSGEMYLEITPITFPVRVKEGIALSQLRLFYGRPERSEVRGRELLKTVLHGTEQSEEEVLLRVDLSEVEIGGAKVAAFCAADASANGEPINLWREPPDKRQAEKRANPCQYWKFRRATDGRIKLEKNEFFILRSKERLKLPPGIAAYCRAIDETIGEMRIHYAGFVHPGFGWKRDDREAGTPLIFEVRGHDVNVNLLDNEVMARMTFYRMSEDPKIIKPSKYAKQALQLSNFFDDWPKRVRVDETSEKVEPVQEST